MSIPIQACHRAPTIALASVTALLAACCAKPKASADATAHGAKAEYSHFTQFDGPPYGDPRLATNDDVALFILTKEQALTRAMEIMEGGPEPYLQVQAMRVVYYEQYPVWHFSASNVIAGGWLLELDGRNGSVVRAKRYPGRKCLALARRMCCEGALEPRPKPRSVTQRLNRKWQTSASCMT